MMVCMKPPPSILALVNRPWLAACLLGLVTFLVFLPSVNYDFVNWDDGAYVCENPLVLGGLSPSSVRGAWTDVVFCNWAPLTILSYQLDVSLFGKEPWGFHLTSILIHAAAAALLSLALFRLTRCPVRSASAAILFAVHPMRVESVAWIAERKDVLSVFFLMLALLAYDWYCRKPATARYALVFLAMLASLLCKATLVTLPVLLLLLDLWPMGRLRLPGIAPPDHAATPSPYVARPWRWVVAEKLPLLGLSAVFVIVTLRTQQDAIQNEIDMPFWTARVPNAILATAWYLWKTFWPTGLYPAYRHTGTEGKPLWLVLACASSLAGVVGIAAASARRLPAVSVGIAWFLVSLLPVLGLAAQQGFQSHADRFTYVPHIGLLIATVWGAAAAIEQRRLPSWAPPAVLTGIIAVLIAADQRQLATWKDSATLWNHVIDRDPHSALAHGNLGVALEAQGQTHAAMTHYQHALAADPAWLPARNNLAAILIERGAIAEARPHVERALRGERDSLTFINLGMLLLAEGKPAEAAAAAREAIRINPASASACFLLGRTLATQGLLEQAIAAYAQALRIDPDHFHARNNLANLLARLRRFDEAIPLYRLIIERDPNAEFAHRNLARAIEEQSRGAASESRASP